MFKTTQTKQAMQYNNKNVTACFTLKAKTIHDKELKQSEGLNAHRIMRTKQDTI